MKKPFELIVEEAVTSLKDRIHFYDVREASFFSLPEDEWLMVNIDIIGDKECSLNLVGQFSVFSTVATKMHGIDLPAAIVPSFAGEFWNMVLGPVIKNVKKSGFSVDIMPSKVVTDTQDLQGKPTLYRYFTLFENEKAIGDFAIYCLYE